MHDLTHAAADDGEGWGETDIWLMVRGRDGARLLLLIENKIDAGFRERQAKRYRFRAAEAVERDEADATRCVLIGSQDYLRSARDAGEFDALVSYESLRAFLSGRATHADAETAARMTHRVEMLTQAVERSRRGWTPQPHEGTTRAWRVYYEHVQQAPTLRMPEPGPKPFNSCFIRFDGSLPTDSRLPRCVIMHKLGGGFVELQFTGWGRHEQWLAERLNGQLDGTMRLRRAAKSLSITIDAPPYDLNRPVDGQLDVITAGIAAAARLREWYLERRDALAACATELAANASSSSARPEA